MKKMYVYMEAKSTLDELKAACRKASEVAAICVPQWFVAPAAAELKETNTEVATIVGLPGGTTSSFAKYAEAKQAVANGADVVIVPVNQELCKTDESAAKNDFVASAAPVKRNGKCLMALVDAATLTEEQAVAAVGFCADSASDLTLVANATPALMQVLKDRGLPAGTFGKAVAEPSELCATATL